MTPTPTRLLTAAPPATTTVVEAVAARANAAMETAARKEEEEEGRRGEVPAGGVMGDRDEDAGSEEDQTEKRTRTWKWENGSPEEAIKTGKEVGRLGR